MAKLLSYIKNRKLKTCLSLTFLRQFPSIVKKKDAWHVSYALYLNNNLIIQLQSMTQRPKKKLKVKFLMISPKLNFVFQNPYLISSPPAPFYFLNWPCFQQSSNYSGFFATWMVITANTLYKTLHLFSSHPGQTEPHKTHFQTEFAEFYRLSIRSPEINLPFQCGL